MRLEHVPTICAAIALTPTGSYAHNTATPIPDVVAPFSNSQTYALSLGNAVRIFELRKYLSSSSADQARVSIVVSKTENKQTPSESIQEIRRLTGITYLQISEIFGVSSRAVYDWLAGKPIASAHHQRIGEVNAVLRFIDRGAATENKNLIFNDSGNGVTYFELLKEGAYSKVTQDLGEGMERASFDNVLSVEAEKHNVPRHFGSSFEGSVDADESEIVPIRAIKVRKANARRKKT